MDLLIRRCRMPSLWASLVGEDGSQAAPVVRILQGHTEFALDQPVRYPLVVVVEAARHRREPGGFERHKRRRRHAEQRRGMSDNGLGCRGVVVADIVDGTWPRPVDRGGERLRQILDMNAGEYLARLVDAFRRTGAECFEGAAAGAVDAGEAEDVHRHAAAAPEIEPARFGSYPPAAALAAWRQCGGLVHPATTAVAVDTRRRKITEPMQALD